MRNENDSGAILPLKILKEAIQAVPAVKYALGITGIVSAIAIVATIGLDFRIATFGTIVMLILMVVLVIFAKLSTTAKRHFIAPAIVLTWFSLFLTIATASLLFTSVFFNFPVNLKGWFVEGSMEEDVENNYKDQEPDRKINKSKNKQLYKRLKSNPIPLFVAYDFHTFSDEDRVGAYYSDIIMTSMFQSNKIRILERFSLSDFLKDTKSQPPHFKTFNNLVGFYGVTHVLEGRVYESEKSLSIRVYSCISKQLIFVKNIDINNFTENKDVFKNISDSIVKSAVDEINEFLMNYK